MRVRRRINRRAFFGNLVSIGVATALIPANAQILFGPNPSTALPGGGGGGSGGVPEPDYSALTQYYVDPANVSGNASDSNDGLSIANPWLTLEMWRTTADAGSVTDIRACNISVTTGSSTGPLLNPVNHGTSAAAPIVLRAYQNETVQLNRDGNNTTLVGVETTSGSQPKDHIIWERLIFDGDDRNALLAYWHNDNGTPPEGLKFRHCTFQNLVLDTDDGLPGGGVLAGGKGFLYARSSHDSYIEHCLFKNIVMTNDNSNLDCIVSYDCDNLTFRYNQFDNCNASACYRVKQQGDNSRAATAGTFYRNHVKANCDSKSFVIGDGWDDGGASASREVTYYFYENLIENGRTFGADRDPVEWGIYVDWYFWNNTIIGGGVQGAGGNDTGWIDTSGFACWNNISFNATYAYNTSGSSVSNPTWDPNVYYDDTKTNYNMFVNETGSFNAHHQYPSIDYNETEWKALGFDANSIFTATDPFEDSAGGDYRLASGSAASGAGRVGGVSGGAAVDLGCFYDEYWLPVVGPQALAV